MCLDDAVLDVTGTVVFHGVLERRAVRSGRPQLEPLGPAREPVGLIEDQLLELLCFALVAASQRCRVHGVEQYLKGREPLLPINDRLPGDIPGHGVLSLQHDRAQEVSADGGKGVLVTAGADDGLGHSTDVPPQR